jgi:SAM-dependent methyltransferase
VDLDDCVIEGTYDLILNFNFLLRDLIAPAVTALKPGGVLIFDTIMASEQLLQAHNPAFLLQPGELIRLFEEYDGEILFSEEILNDEIPTARILFRKSCAL